MRTKDSNGGTYGRAYQMGSVLLSLLVLPACFDKTIIGGPTQVVGIDDHSGAQPSPTPSDGLCTVARLDAGTDNDVKTIKQGGFVDGGVIVVGKQGEPVPSSCAVQPQWSQPTPCILSGSPFAIRISAPASAAIGSVCEASVTVAGYSGKGSVSLEVVP